jgi:hypothetical protein
MKHVITFFICMLSITGFAEDDGKKIVFKGKVTDVDSSEGIAGAEIKVEGTNLKTYADFDGNFTLEGLRPGSYKIVVKMMSYEDASIGVSLDQSESIELSLKAK